ncbi:hypothetical protein HQO27_26795 [Rhodococcus fascians]|nr:hypothetical protein [Rhodococcus fascians]MBY4434392.1 hypothetical protein [Rhodococcus fascians]
MRFPKVLCKKCNGDRSQPFDRAYDHFIQKVWDDPEYFRNKNQIDMDEFFAGDPQGSQKLARYYMKNIGCRIAEIGFQVPQQVVDFMDGTPLMPNATIVLYKDYSGHDQFKRAGSDGHYLYANRMHSPESPSHGPLTAFCAEVQDGPIGAVFWWDTETAMGINICSQRIVPLRERRTLPYHELHQNEWDRARLMMTALDAKSVPPYPS